MKNQDKAIDDFLSAYGKMELTHETLSRALFSRTSLPESFRSAKRMAATYQDTLDGLETAFSDEGTATDIANDCIVVLLHSAADSVALRRRDA